MSKATHTERPWTLRPVNEEIGEYEIVGPNHSDETGESEYIAVVCGGLPEYEDNARLIAAAPELLDAVQLFVTWEDWIDDPDWLALVEYARSAIAKATGKHD